MSPPEVNFQQGSDSILLMYYKTQSQSEDFKHDAILGQLCYQNEMIMNEFVRKRD